MATRILDREISAAVAQEQPSPDEVNGPTAYDLFLYPVKDGMPQIPIRAPLALLAIGVVLLGGYRWYQMTYALTYGLDAFEPEFQTYFMNAFWIQMTLITIFGAIAIPLLWFSRPKDVLAMTPLQELSRYYLVFAIMTVASVFVVVILALYAESDAAWHQITIRDTDFTPTHIGLFYYAIPIGIVSLAMAFIWLHTRMPDYYHRVSIPLCIIMSGPILIMPNVGFNEWGHTFFYAEELFAAPIHYGFVTLGWALFGLGGFIIQALSRVHTLTMTAKQSQEKLQQAA
ncbi:MAG: methane monooxygenase/ammonia monooxygenase subunit C [Gammaproteobacteria bacterium]|nr:MAG: methane monooxygenase/ammonia monooxygenase subunit C [Gammaproteobacteria bacterium]